MRDLSKRSARKVQLSTDGHKAYLDAGDDAFGGDEDYAMLMKMCGAERPGEARYSPANIIGIRKEEVCGAPQPRHTGTSHVERQNPSIRMGMRRFACLANAHSKNSKTTLTPSSSTSCTTTIAKSTARSA
jgi:hypothetical protein